MSPQGIELAKIGPFTVYLPTSGGKAGKGNAKTTTLQVREAGRIVKKIRFNTDDLAAARLAANQARAFCHAQVEHRTKVKASAMASVDAQIAATRAAKMEAAKV